MTLEQYANIAEILGVTIAIITVGFLALQIQQSNKLMAGEAQRARSQYAGQAMSAIAENGELAAIMVKDVNGETLNAVEALRMKWMWMRQMWGYQTSFQQLPREEIEPAANIFRRNFGLWEYVFSDQDGRTRARWSQCTDLPHDGEKDVC